MATPIEDLTLFFTVGQVTLLLATAVYVAWLPPRGTAKWLYALSIFLLGAAQVGDILGRLDAPGGSDAAYWYFVDVSILQTFAVAACAAFYPSHVRWRAPEGALLAAGAGLHVLYGATITFAREAFYRTPAGEVAYWAMVGGTVLIGLSCLLRLPRVPERERRWAAWIVFTLVAGATMLPSGFLVGGAVQLAIGDTPFVPSGAWGAAVHLLVTFVLAPILLVLWWRREARAPVVVGAAYGVFNALMYYAGGTPWYLSTVLLGVIALFVFARGTAFGVESAPRGIAATLAIVAAVDVFLVVVSVTLADFGDAPLSLAAGTVAGLVLGGIAAFLALPRAALPLRDEHEETTQRLSAYGIALDRELRAGRSPDEASVALADLRAALRVSDDEHAALVGGRAPAATGDALMLGRYKPLRVLGEGGSGVTRLCRDERVGRQVVLKSIRGDDPSAARVAILLREARAVGAIKHPNVITLHDVVDAGREAVIVMEHAERGSLRDVIAAGGPLREEEWRRVAAGLLRALEAVHAAGVIHRDIKPSNVLIDAHGDAKLADFGIASIPGFETTVGGLRGAAVGTFRYMSPEQAKGRPATPRSDLFSAAATLYEARTGTPYLEPQPGESAVEVQMRAASAGPFQRAVEPPTLGAWFARALDPEPGARFASAREMRETLEGALG